MGTMGVLSRGADEDRRYGITMVTRRHLLAASVGLAATALHQPFSLRVALAQQTGPNLGPNRLVTLGTRGGPAIRTGFTPSPSANLIVYDNVPYVIDTGYGVSGKLVSRNFLSRNCATSSSRTTTPTTTRNSACLPIMPGRWD